MTAPAGSASVEWEIPEVAGVARWELSTWTPPRPVPMLERDVLVGLAQGQRRCLEETGGGFGQVAVRFVNGFGYMGRSSDSDDVLAERRERFRRHARAFESSGTDIWSAEVRPIVESRLLQLRKDRRRMRDLSGRVSRLEAAIHAGTDAMGNLHWRMWDPTPFDWTAVYRELTGGSGEEAALLLGGLGHQTARLVRRLRSLARQVQADPTLQQVVTAADTGRLQEVSVSFDRGFRRLLSDYGRRTGFGAGSSVTFATPTWSMRPALVLGLIDSYAKSDLDAGEARERRARRQRAAVATRVRRRLKSDGTRLHRFEVAYDQAIRRVRMSEDSNHLLEQESIGAMREAIDDVGRWLVDRSALDTANDVYHLSLDDLRVLSSDPDRWRGGRDLVRSRVAELDAASTLAPPQVLGTAPIAPPSVSPRGGRPASGDRGQIQGVGVAPGTARGRAHIAPRTSKPPAVEPGEVLVAADAGPAWTPVFPVIAAIVLDGGSLTDHAAIMARDLGIPAVMRAHDATTRIAHGSEIVVDGTAGTVRTAT